MSDLELVKQAMKVLLGVDQGWLPDPSGGDTVVMAGKLVTTHVPPRVAAELLELLNRIEGALSHQCCGCPHRKAVL